MSRTKYLTFGLRADRNLSDLTNPTEALDNILDDLSTELDPEGVPLSFTSSDILPLVGIAETNLSNIVNEAGQSTQLIGLAGSTIQSTSTSNTLINVEPRITIQDYIDNYKAVLGDPPWTQGGTGPNATFIPSDRLNANTTDNLNSIIACDPGNTQGGGAQDLTVGNRYRIEVLATINQNGWNEIAGTVDVTYAIGSIFTCAVTVSDAVGDGNHNTAACRNVTLPSGNSGTANANALKAGEVFTTKVDASLTSTVGPADFWSNGQFKLNGRIHPTFTDSYGGIQWEGYLTGRYTQIWFNTGFYIIEEDTVVDGSDNNWTMLKAITSESTKTFYNIVWEPVSDVTRIELQEEDYKRVAIGMTITLNGNVATVENIYRSYDLGSSSFKYYATLDIDVGSTESSGSIQTFEFDSINDELDSGYIYITEAARGSRRRVRYTAYWPTLTQNQKYRVKHFEEDVESNEKLNFFYFYKTSGVTDSFGKYTFPFFNANRFYTLKQTSTAKLTVADTVSLEYVPKQETAGITYGYNDSNNTVAQKNVRLEQTGTLVSNDLADDVFSGTSVGDWVITVPAFNTDWANAGSKAYAFQIEEYVSADKVYVSSNYRTVTGLAEGAAHDIIIVKNKGLVGIYKRDARSLPLVTDFRKLDTGTDSMNKDLSLISRDDLIHNITFTGGSEAGTSASHDHPLKINSSVISGGATEIIAVAHPNNSADADSGTILPALGLSLVYASKGLNDLSGQAECQGVYGLEVSVNSPAASPQKIYVTDISRGSAMVNDVVYYKGSTSGTPIIDEATDIANGTNASLVTTFGTDATGSFIEISRQIQSTIPAGATIVLVPDGYGAPGRNKNREYCVIPLNTAPPFESTDLGLATPSTHKNLMTEKLVYKTLSVSVPPANLKSLSVFEFGSNNANNTPNKYLDLKHTVPGGATTTYKVLINDNTLTTI